MVVAPRRLREPDAAKPIRTSLGREQPEWAVKELKETRALIFAGSSFAMQNLEGIDFSNADLRGISGLYNSYNPERATYHRTRVTPDQLQFLRNRMAAEGMPVAKEVLDRMFVAAPDLKLIKPAARK